MQRSQFPHHVRSYGVTARKSGVLGVKAAAQLKLSQVVDACSTVGLCFAFARAGTNMTARMAMLAITTSSSISVNAGKCRHPHGTRFCLGL